MKQLMSGNEAIARGAFEAGIRIGSAYPGTPSTEIFENLPRYKDNIYCEWAPNEKVAFEVAYGASVGGVRSMVAMKHVGLNVAADPMFTAAYLGVGRGFLIVTADDPSMHSSQNEQDNRYYAYHAHIAMVEPSDSQECKDYVKAALEISEQYDIPVLMRVSTRVCHSKSLVEQYEPVQVDPIPYKRNAAKFTASPALAYINRKKLDQKMKDLEEFSNRTELNRVEKGDGKIGVVTSGISYQYAKEAFPEGTSFLKLGFTHPLPMDKIREFASSVETLYIVEETEPVMETEIKAAGIPCIGKEKVPYMYELNPEILKQSVFGIKPETADVAVKAASRPPVLCPGCPHRGFFYTMSKRRNAVVTSDIGCYTLGGSAPLNASDSCVCMGAGFTLGMGISKALELTGQTDKKVFGVMGDSTFFHSGMTGALEILYNKGKMVPVVLDNRITGMTGHQDNPGSGHTLLGQEANMTSVEKVLEAFGYQNIITVDPNDLAAMEKAVNDAEASTVPAAIVCRRPCLLIKGVKHDIGLCVVDTDKCMSCRSCLRVGCPAIFMKEGKAFIDPTLCVGCKVCAQVCPFEAIERKGE